MKSNAQNVDVMKMNAELMRPISMHRTFRPVIRVDQEVSHRIPSTREQSQDNNKNNNLSPRKPVHKHIEQNEQILQSNYLKSIGSKFDANTIEFD